MTEMMLKNLNAKMIEKIMDRIKTELNNPKISKTEKEEISFLYHFMEGWIKQVDDSMTKVKALSEEFLKEGQPGSDLPVEIVKALTDVMNQMNLLVNIKSLDELRLLIMKEGKGIC